MKTNMSDLMLCAHAVRLHKAIIARESPIRKQLEEAGIKDSGDFEVYIAGLAATVFDKHRDEIRKIIKKELMDPNELLQKLAAWTTLEGPEFTSNFILFTTQNPNRFTQNPTHP